MKQEDHLSTKLKANLRNKVRLHLKKKRIKGGREDGRSEHETHMFFISSCSRSRGPGHISSCNYSHPGFGFSARSVSNEILISVGSQLCPLHWQPSVSSTSLYSFLYRNLTHCTVLNVNVYLMK